MKRPVKIVLAPNAFKESLSALDAARAMEKGLKNSGLSCNPILAPLSDGGDGLLEFFENQKGTEVIHTVATNPLGQQIPTKFAIYKKNTAIIEMALISGLALVPPQERDPMTATSLGTGELIKQAYDRGIRDFILGLGGSATNDGGVGLATALGYQFLDSMGAPIPRGGQGLKHLAKIGLHKDVFNFSDCTLNVACDVQNPLLGHKGATHTFGRQKGLTDAGIQKLEVYMQHLSSVVEKEGSSFHQQPGAGAAGGTGYILSRLFKAQLKPGSEIIMAYIGFNEIIKGAGLILTGEGKLDSQSGMGKIPGEVARKGFENGIPVIALAGLLEEGWETLCKNGLTSAFTISPEGSSVSDSMKNAAQYISQKTKDVVEAFFRGN